MARAHGLASPSLVAVVWWHRARPLFAWPVDRESCVPSPFAIEVDVLFPAEPWAALTRGLHRAASEAALLQPLVAAEIWERRLDATVVVEPSADQLDALAEARLWEIAAAGPGSSELVPAAP